MANGDGGGAGNAFSNLFKNQLLLQYLSAAGQDLVSGRPGNLNAAVQQNIGAQSYMKLLQKMLAGEVPEGGKVSMDSKGLSINLPRPMNTQSAGPTQDLLEGGVPEGSSAPALSTPQAAGGGSGLDNLSRMMRVFNPFVSSQSNFSASDLAGLSTSDISKALEFRFAQEDVARRSVSDLADIAYKQGLLDYYGGQLDLGRSGQEIEGRRAAIAESTELRQWAELIKKSPYEVPGLGTLTANEFNKLPPNIQSYAYASYQNKLLGRENISFEDWEDKLDPLEMERLYDLSKSDPGFGEFYFKSKTAGAPRISIGEKVETAKALAGIKGQTYFKDPSWVDDVNKHLDSPAMWLIIGNSSSPTARTDEAIKYIEAKIRAGGGFRVGDPRIAGDGKTIIWKVKWPSGDEETIRYASE